MGQGDNNTKHHPRQDAEEETSAQKPLTQKAHGKHESVDLNIWRTILQCPSVT